MSAHCSCQGARSAVSIPQAVWIACNAVKNEVDSRWDEFQYRKRYGLHAMERCLMNNSMIIGVSIPQAVWIACNKWRKFVRAWLAKFQYRKRYGLHAIQTTKSCIRKWGSFNTASGMDCMQLSLQREMWRVAPVSIPQAVWIACNVTFRSCGARSRSFNTASGMDCMQLPYEQLSRAISLSFQYRKRYGLHAILSPGSLGNSEPRSRFSDTDPLFAFFPKCAELFCREKCFERGLKPVIARALLSTKEI